MEKTTETRCSKHTPGPWEVKPGKNSDGDETLLIESDKENIATMDVVSINGGPFGLPARAWDNAILIAAAPDLLMAAECALWSLEATGRDVCDDGTPTKPARLLRAAIKKAKGES